MSNGLGKRLQWFPVIPACTASLNRRIHLENTRSIGRLNTGPCSLRDNSMAAQHQDALGDIEKRLQKLVAKYQQLQVENQSLRESQANLTAEKAHLINQNEQARLRVEAMIGRLKTLERHS